MLPSQNPLRSRTQDHQPRRTRSQTPGTSAQHAAVLAGMFAHPFTTSCASSSRASANQPRCCRLTPSIPPPALPLEDLVDTPNEYGLYRVYTVRPQRDPEGDVSIEAAFDPMASPTRSSQHPQG
ncbi:hypothetical protein C8Q70DRAFT_1053223 [Cubamyces menziesii]|nr:hypothetical protein C8Q70DRAFT_1053223 [Cubamyces menziesii]